MDEEIRGVLDMFPVHAESAGAYGRGHIHATYRVEAEEGKFILQKLKFAEAGRLEDMERVIEHLKNNGMLAPTIVKTKKGELAYRDTSAWRLTTYIPGKTIERRPSLQEVASGTRLVARFHTALLEYPHAFEYEDVTFHDIARSLRRLKEVDAANESSEKYAACHPLAETLLERGKNIRVDFRALPKHAMHGDLKINNLRFSDEGHALALIDLDTVGPYTLPVELGDMLRSWCKVEEKETAHVNADVWHAIMENYRQSVNFVTPDEWRSVPEGFAAITLELAARYLTDVYEENFFAHDKASPLTGPEQHLMKARAGLSLLDDFLSRRSEFEVEV